MAPSPIKSDEKAPGPVKADEKAPSPIKPDEKAPSLVQAEEKAHSLMKSYEKAPSSVEPDEKTRSPVKTVEEAPSSVKADEKAPSPTKPDEKTPSPVEPDEKTPSPVKTDEKAPSLFKSEEPVKPDEKAPSLVQADEKAHSLIKSDEKAPSSVEPDEKTRSPVKSDEEAPSLIKPDEKAPSLVKADEKAPSPIKPAEKQPSPVQADEKAPSQIKPDEMAQSPVKADEETPSPVKPDETTPSAIKTDEKAPSPIKPDEKVPGLVEADEKAPSPIKPDEKAPSPVKADEKAPSPTKPDEKAPSPVEPDEKTPRPVKTDEKAPSPVKADEKAPSPTKPDEKAPSPVEPDEKTPSPVKPDEKAPSPVKADEKAPSPTKPDDKAPSPVEPDEKTPSPVKTDEEVPSLIKPEEPVKPDEKAPSPIKPDEKASTPVKADEKATSPVTHDEKAPSPITADGKDHSPVKPVEKAYSSVKPDEKMASSVMPDYKPIVDDVLEEKAPSAPKLDEKAPSPVKPDDIKPVADMFDEKVVGSSLKFQDKEETSFKSEEMSLDKEKLDNGYISPSISVQEVAYSFFDDAELEERLKDFKPMGDSEEKTVTQYLTVTERGVVIVRTFIITSIVQKYYSITRTTIIYKIVINTIEEDELPDGTKVRRTYKKTTLSDTKPSVEQLLQLCSLQMIDEEHHKETQEIVKKVIKPVELGVISVLPTPIPKESSAVEDGDFSIAFKPGEKEPKSVAPSQKADKKDISPTKAIEKAPIPMKPDDFEKLSITETGVDVVDDEDFESISRPIEDSTTKTEIVTEDGAMIQRKITVTTTTQEFINSAQTVKRIKTTIRTVVEDEHPDGSVIKKTSEKITLADESIVEETDNTDEADNAKIEEILSNLTPSEPEITEDVKIEEITENKIIIQRTIVTKIIKTKYSDIRGVPHKVKTETIVTTSDKYPDGTTKTTVDTSITITNFSIEEHLTKPHPEESTVSKQKPDTPDEKAARPAKLDEKATSPVKPDEKTPSSVQSDEVGSSPTKLDDKAPSPTKSDEKAPSSVKPDEKPPSPVKADEKVRSPIEHEKKVASPVKPDDKAPSLVKPDEKALSPVKPDEKALSLVKSDEKAPRSDKPDEKAPSSVKFDEEAPSPTMLDGKVPSPIKPDEKPSSPVKPDEKAPRPAKSDEKATSPVKPDEKAPSPTKPDEQAPSPVKPNEEVFSPSKLLEKEPKSDSEKDRRLEKSEGSTKEMQRKSKDDEKDIDEKEYLDEPTHITSGKMIPEKEISPKIEDITDHTVDDEIVPKSINIIETKLDKHPIDKKVDILDVDTDEKEIYEDGESVSEDSQVLEKVDDKHISVTTTKMQSLISQSEEMLKQEKMAISQSHHTIKPHDIKKRSIVDEKYTQEMIESITDTHTPIPHGSSSEDVSRETSLEEKYSFEGTEKSEKKSLKDKLYSDETLSHKVDSLTIDDSVTSTLKDTDSTRVHDDKTQELGSPKDEIPLSEASDSGVHSIPTDLGPSDEKIVVQAMKDSAVHLMESIHKAFEEDTVQQGIKTESIESLVRVSTPPTVPVSPLPKTPSSFQDVKISDGVQSEVTYDKSDGSEETITKVVHVGDDVLTQRISTSTEKVPKKTTTLADDESDLLSLMQNVGKIKTETDTVTKIIKEGENVVTQTITTVTTKEVISREDETPQNIKTTIETTTLSKGSDGSTTTTKDTQTLLSECSSSLRSTSSMDLYAKDRIDKDYLENEEKFEIRDLTDKRESSVPKDVESLKSFLSETDESDDNVEDTIIDTDVSKRIIKENNKDVMETVTTTTKKETIKVSDIKKLIRTTIETNVTKEHPDGSKDVQKNVEVKTEEIILDSSSNLDNILSEFVICGEPEESVTSKTEEIKQETFTIRRTIVTRIVKIKYANKQGVPKKLKTDTTITTTDDYPDGSSRTKVDSSTSLTDIDVEPVETLELQGMVLVEDKSVDSDQCEKSITINGKNALQIITTTTTKEILSNIDRTKRKLKTTVETVTETMLPDSTTEVTKDVKVSVSDIGIDAVDESLEGFESIGKPMEDTTTETEIVTEDGAIIKRKITITTTTQEFINTARTVKRIKTTIRTVVEDEHPDGSVIKKTSEKITLADESIVEATDDTDDAKIEEILNSFTPSEPEITEDVKTEEITENKIIIQRTIVTKIIKTKYSDSRGVPHKVKTETIVTTSDKYPDGTTKMTVDTSITITDVSIEEQLTKQKAHPDETKATKSEDKPSKPVVNGVHEEPELAKQILGKPKVTDKSPMEAETPIHDDESSSESSKVDSALKEFIPVGEPEISESSESVDVKEKDIIIKRIIVTKIIKTKYSDKQGNLRKLKTVTILTTTDKYPDGSARTIVESSTSVTDIEVETADDVDGFDPIGEPIEDTTTETKTITEDGIIIKRKITITTTVQEYTNGEQNIKRTKTTVRTVIEDEHPDGSVVTRASEKISLVDETLKAHEPTAEEQAEMKKLEAALKDLSPSGEPEISEDIDIEEIKEDGIQIKRIIVTKIVKTRYMDSQHVLKKLKIVKTVTTTDEYPDGAAKTTVDTSTSISEIKEDQKDIPSQHIVGYEQVGDVQINVETKHNLILRDGKELQQIITIKTTKEVLESQDGKKKVRTTVETESQIGLPDGNTEITRDKKVTLDDYKSETFYENLVGYIEIDKPKESVQTAEDSITENGIKIIRKITVITTAQEFENTVTRSRKIKTTTRTETEDEYPDGTVITKKKVTVTITDVTGHSYKKHEDVPERPDDLPISDTEVVESMTEDFDVKNEILQRGSITIRRKITIATKREFLASNDVNIKRVRTTVETTTVDEFPDGATETTKDVKITISEFQKTSDSDLQAALQGLEPTGKVKTSVDKKTNIIKSDHGEKITQTITTNVTKEELCHCKTNDVAVKTVTETITENAKDDGTVETTKDVRTQITYLPPGTGLDDWSPEELEEIEKQPVAQEERQILDNVPGDTQKPTDIKEKPESKPKKQRSPVGEITTDTETYTKVIKEGDNEITQTITVVTTKEVISPEKIKITVETTTVSKGSDGVTKTTKSTKTTISEFREEYEETVDTGESEKSFSKLSSKTGDMRSSSAASDDLDHPGISSPPSDISSRGSRAATHIWGTESSGMYYSDEDGQGSPSSTKSQIAHSPRSNLSFELDTAKSQHDLFEKPDPMSTSIYGQLPEDDSYKSSSHSEVTTTELLTSSARKMTEDFLTKERSEHQKHSDATFFKEADEHFEKAIEEHKKVSGSQVISNITAKYELDSKFHSSSSHSSKEESTITLKDIKSETKKVTESSSSSKQETKFEKSEVTSETSKPSKDPIESWGKPLGLPSPIGAPMQTDGKSTPKKQASSTVLNKNKINQEKSKEAKSRASESPSKKKAPAPVYMELTYVPHHGNSYYSAIEFFKRVRARYYVFSGTEPSKEIYNALLDAKKTWEDKDLEVTIIPTYDTDVLGYWVTENEEALEKYKIDLSPSASRCTINLQDHETSCAAYRLEF
ncbi:microtubule-associated protein futsch-like isoform X2 [Spodoptera litura]|uniref:Microtubule-associated protein futsch-like isoform X2 n=1 Tax=Spodoptera litura TaxID=69820 RepID=A0A9J7EPL7_SPOLT|nr:microtubule-associated protein futsch-like isoform X2 [Spodoptera litura]